MREAFVDGRCAGHHWLLLAVFCAATFGVWGGEACFGIVIDDFEVGEFSLTATEYGSGVDPQGLEQTGLATGNVAGGKRTGGWDLYSPESLEVAPSVTADVSASPGTDGVLRLTGNSKAIAAIEIDWGRFGPDLDLTEGGIHDRFLVKIPVATTDLLVSFLVRTRRGGAAAPTGVSAATVLVTGPGVVSIPYDQFTSASLSSGLADFDEVDSVFMQVQNVSPGGPWAIEISEVVTGVPEPGALVGIIMGGVVVAGRRRRVSSV